MKSKLNRGDASRTSWSTNQNIVRASQVSGAHPLMAAIKGCSKPTRAFIVSGTTINRRPQSGSINRRSVAARGEDNGRKCHTTKVRAKHGERASCRISAQSGRRGCLPPARLLTNRPAAALRTYCNHKRAGERAISEA